MRAVTTAEMRELDRITIEELGVPGEVLMERVGYEVAKVARRIILANKDDMPFVQIFAGRGNNGGDAFVAARVLDEMGFRVGLLLAGDVGDVDGDAGTHFDALEKTDVDVREFTSEDEWSVLLNAPQFAGTLLIDGLLGTGISGPARGVVAAAIDVINSYSKHAPVVSIDVPSGLNSDTGVAEGKVVRADVTVTIAAPKLGLLLPGALEVVGNVEVVDIGIPPEVKDSETDLIDLITGDDVGEIMNRRDQTSHKGCHGHVLLIGGAPGFSGAIAMAAMAALRSGAGLVSVLVPESISAIVAGLVPEAIVHTGAVNSCGSLKGDSLDVCGWGSLGAVGEDAPRMAKPPHGCLGSVFSSILVGPGMTTHRDGAEILRKVLESSVENIVLDADALNILASMPELMIKRRGGIIMTPHPGEMARLLELDTKDVQKDRFAAARDAAERFGTTVVLKGAGTLVVNEKEIIHINLTGNPCMATGGMGDVLAGLMAGIVAQGYSVFNSACAAVYIHGSAGDFVAREVAQSGITATDVIKKLPYVLRNVIGR